MVKYAAYAEFSELQYACDWIHRRKLETNSVLFILPDGHGDVKYAVATRGSAAAKDLIDTISPGWVGVYNKKITLPELREDAEAARKRVGL